MLNPAWIFPIVSIFQSPPPFSDSTSFFSSILYVLCDYHHNSYNHYCALMREVEEEQQQVQGLDHVEQELNKFLCLDDDDSTSSPFLSLLCSSISLDLSLEKLLESSASDADRTVLIDRALRMGSMLIDAAKHSSRKRASKHNSFAWRLPPDLTVKNEFGEEGQEMAELIC